MRKKSSKNAITGEVMNLALVGGGFLAGHFGGKMIDKALKVDEGVAGFNAKKFAKPIVQLGLGTVGAIKLKNQKLKMIALGVGASGLTSAASTITNKNLLAGGPGLGQATSIYQEPMQLSIGKYNPDLPRLSPGLPQEASYAESMYGTSDLGGEVVESEFEII